MDSLIEMHVLHCSYHQIQSLYRPNIYYLSLEIPLNYKSMTKEHLISEKELLQKKAGSITNNELK